MGSDRLTPVCGGLSSGIAFFGKIRLITGVAAFLALAAALLCGPSPVAAAPVQPDPSTPIVLVMMDELPTASLMNSGGSIDRRRFPNLAAFASTSTWYRDNVAAGDFTGWAIPPILTGRLGNKYLLPTNAAQPDNIFNLLGADHRLHVLEELTEICSKSMCPDGHQGEVTDQIEADEFVKEKFHLVDPAVIRKFTKTMPAGPRSVSIIHMLLPHQPTRFTPEGTSYPGGPLGFTMSSNNDIWSIDDAGVSLVQQRHLLQAGYADRMVGRILDKVVSNGDWKKAMVIVTADHGANFDPDGFRRNADERDIGAILNPPLFIKYPGQSTGEVSEAPTQAIDILPTIAKQLGIDDLFPVDGLPIDELPADRLYTVTKDYMQQIQVTPDQVRRQRAVVLATMERRFGTGGLWTLGPRPELLGMRPGKRSLLAGAKVSIDKPSRLEKVRPSSGRVPSLVSGVVNGVGGNQEVAVALNGRIVATTRTFIYEGAMRFGAMIRPSFYRAGANRVTVYRAGQGRNLRTVRGTATSR